MRHQVMDAVLHSGKEVCKISNRTLDGLCPFWYAPCKWKAERGNVLFIKKTRVVNGKFHKSNILYLCNKKCEDKKECDRNQSVL